MMSLTEQLLTISIVAVTTFFTRYVPFAVFSDSTKTPPFIQELGEFLPAAIIGMLVIYCYKDITPSTLFENWPFFLASVMTVVVHIKRNNMMLSILVGTACYVLILNLL